MTSVYIGKLFILYCVLSSVSANFFNLENRIRLKRQSDCGFKCKSGECISDNLVCNGKEDCKDSSDEGEECKNLGCHASYFRCNYGACIDKSKVCDGRKDCKDNSDEISCTTIHTPQIENKGNCNFRCVSDKQCIGDAAVCDGKKDCKDGSDETESCINLGCQTNDFRCKYGACIHNSKVCDGNIDCHDQSDEDPGKCRGTSSSTNCILPNHPENGFWEVQGIATNKRPKEVIQETSILQFKCKRGYKLSTESNITACLGSNWIPNITPTCLKTCPPIESSNTITVECRLNNQRVSCLEPVEGTKLKFECRNYYEPEGVKRTRICRENGLWNLPRPVCLPICGEEYVSSKPLIINGTVVPRGKYPWQAAVYTKRDSSFQNICGGSILNLRVILSAAHCVTDLSTGVKFPKENFEVAVGKYYNKYDDDRDKNAQFSKLSFIHVHKRYRGIIQHYDADIALLVTETKLQLTQFAQPICLDASYNIYLTEGQIGVVAGWGYTEETGKPSDVLKEIAMPLGSTDTCNAAFPAEWRERYFLPDKLCAGHNKKNMSVCNGDSGGALAFRNAYNKNRYYVHGIVSLSIPNDAMDLDSCNKQQYALFTKVSEYVSFVEEVTSEFVDS